MTCSGGQRRHVKRCEDSVPLGRNVRCLRAAAEKAQVPAIFVVTDPVHHVAEQGIAGDLGRAGIGAVKAVGAADDEMHPDLSPGPCDCIVIKRTYTAFFKTDLKA